VSIRARSTLGQAVLALALLAVVIVTTCVSSPAAPPEATPEIVTSDATLEPAAPRGTPELATPRAASATSALVSERASALTPDASVLPRFEASPTCPPEASRCGFVVVPERHARPDGPTIRLAVVVYDRRDRDARTDPVVYIQGGPGSKRLGSATQTAGDLLSRHDVVVYDQRGVGSSRPTLDCPEIEEQRIRAAAENLRGPSAQQHDVEAALACRDRLLARGVDLAAYTTSESAADLNDIRLALGYARLNLVGISYGTYLAQVTMRDFPQAIWSVVLDSVVPLVPSQREYGAERALERVFVLCAADPACDRAYPVLRDTYLRVVQHLAAQPIALRLAGAPGDAVFVDDVRFEAVIFRLLYAGPGPIPAFAAAVDRGDYGTLGEAVGSLLRSSRTTSEGLALSVSCGGFADLARLAAARPVSQASLLSALVSTPSRLPEICRSWPSDPSLHAPDAPIQSDLPTLIIAGQLDPVTPPQNGLRVRAGLPTSFYLVFPESGHVPGVRTACGRSIIQAFVDEPSQRPDSACMDTLRLEFRLP